MKINCELCGSALRIADDGQSVICQGCGIEYSIDRVRQLLQKNMATATSTEETTEPQAEENFVELCKEDPEKNHSEKEPELAVHEKSEEEIREEPVEHAPAFEDIIIDTTQWEMEEEKTAPYDYFEKAKKLCANSADCEFSKEKVMAVWQRYLP